MLILENILSQEIVQKIGWTLLHFSWQAMVIALILAILLKLLRKSSASLRYIFACLALALIVLLPVITIQLVPVSAPHMQARIVPVPAPTVLPTVEMPASETIVLEEPLQSESVTLMPADSWKQRAVATLEPALPYIVSGWLVGVFVLSLWHLGGWTQLQRLKRRMVKQVDDPLHSKLKVLAQKVRVRQTVQFMESALVQIPTVVGWLRPVILLPASALTGLSSEQLEAILAHELAHIRRCDYLINILQTVVEILGFYHPAVWWVSHKIRAERENCCDDLAVSISGDRVCYARALTSMEEIRTDHGQLAVAASGGNLSRRICRLVGKDSAEKTSFSWIPAATAILLIIALTIPTTLAFTNKSHPQQTELKTNTPVEGEKTGSNKNSWPSKFMADKTRIVHFPKGRTLGTLYLRDSDIEGRKSWEGWKELGQARGEISVPEGKELRLAVREKTFENLADLAALRANDIQNLHISSGGLQDADMLHLKGLTGLQSLTLSSGSSRSTCPLTGDGLVHLKGMSLLRNLTIQFTKIHDENLAHLKYLTNLERLSILNTDEINGDGLAYLKDLTSLRTLSFYMVPIEDAGLENLRGMDQLERLSLQYTKVADDGLAHLKGLTGLKYLVLPPDTTDAGLANLKGLSSLQELVISSDKVSSDGLAHLKSMSGLKSLSLGVKMNDQGWAHLHDMPQLKEIKVSMRMMDNAGMKGLKGLTSVTSLNLGRTQISDAGLSNIEGLTALEYLCLKNTTITDTGLTYLKGLTSLRDLDLEGTQITDVGLANLQGLSSLRTLWLQRTDITDAGLVHLKGLQSLGTLYLNDTQVGEAGLVNLKGLRSLQHLTLNNTNVSGDGLAHLKSLKSLRELYMRVRNISETGLRHLKEMTWLHELGLGEGSISEADLRDLENALPDCIVNVRRVSSSVRPPKPEPVPAENEQQSDSQVEDDLLLATEQDKKSSPDSFHVAVPAKSPAPSAQDKTIIQVDCLVVEVFADSKMDIETTIVAEKLLGIKISLRDTKVDVLLRKAAGATAATKDKSAENKRVMQDQFKTFVDMLISKGYLRTLMNPTIQVVDGKTAKILSTQKISSTQGSIEDSIQITPHVFADGHIILQVEATISSKSIPKGVEQIPTITTREVSTLVRTSPGESRIIGGLKETGKSTKPNSNVKDSEKQATEVLFILTPTIITSTTDSQEKTDVPVKVKSTLSAYKLKQLGLAVIMYADDHDKKLPDTLEALKPYIDSEKNYFWLLNNVEYLGKNKNYRPNQPHIPVAYDKTQIDEQSGTDVLFLDGHVEFLTPQKLKEFDIIKAATAVTRPDESAEPNEPMETVNLNNVEMKTIVEKLAEWTGKVIIPTAELMKQKITIYAPEKLPRSKAVAVIYSALRLKGYTTEETVEAIILKPVKEAKPAKVPAISHDDSLEMVENKDRIVQKFYKLEYYSPLQMAQIVKPLLSHTGYISADEKTGNLLIIDTVKNLLRIENIIAQFDVPEAGQTITEIFEIRYGDPTEIVKSLRMLISGRPGFGAIIEPGKQPVVLIPEPRRNWIIAKASAEDMKQISEWIKKLDRKEPIPASLLKAEKLKGLIETGKRVESAKKLSNLGKALLIYADDHDDKYPNSLHTFTEYLKLEDFNWALVNVEYLAKGKTILVRPDTPIAYDKTLLAARKGTNVLFNDSHVDFVKPERLKELGISANKILIETRLLSVSEDFLKDIGLDANSVHSSDAWSEHLLADSAAEPNSNTYSLILDDLHVSFLLKAVQTHQGSKMLAAPQVLCQEGKTASIGIMTEEYYVLGYTEPNDPSDKPEPKTDKVELGTRIWLKPELTSDNENIKLDFKMELRQLLGYEERKYKGKYIYLVPRTEVVSTEMPCLIPDGKTLLIVGQKITDTVSAAPILSRIPVVGEMFRSRDKTKDQRILLILVKPIINPQQKASKILPGQEDSEEHIKSLATQLEKKLNPIK